MLVITSLHDNYDNLLGSLERYNKASDTILCDFKAEKKGFIFFINQDECLESIAKYKVGRRVATKKNAIEFYDKKDLTYPITKELLISENSKFSKAIEKLYFLTTVSLLTPALGTSIITTIVNINPDTESYFKDTRHYSEIRIKDYPNLKNEFDAISLPLKLIGLKNISFEDSNVGKKSLLEKIYVHDMIEIFFNTGKTNSVRLMISKAKRTIGVCTSVLPS